MEVMFIIMGSNIAILVLLSVLVKGALDMESIDKAFPTGQTLNGGVK